MNMGSGLRKFALTMHVVTSIGWLGAVVSFLALAIVGLSTPEPRLVGAVYSSMVLVARFVIVPLSIASTFTGVVLSLGTPWGLFRHYWIVLKVLITIPSTLLLLVHMQPIRFVASIAAITTLSSADYYLLRTQLVIEAGTALLVLLVATALSVYKPKGITPYGVRRQYEPQPLTR